MTVKEKLLNKLVNKHMPRRYYGHEARKYAKIIAIEYAAYLGNIDNSKNHFEGRIEEAGCDFCRDEQGYTIGNMYVCDKCGRQVP